MKKIAVFTSCLFYIFCTNKDLIREEKIKKAEQKRKEIFEAINIKWDFKPVDFSDELYHIIQQWAEWNNFCNELLEKPQTDTSAFQRKTAQLVKQVENLQTTIPDVFNQSKIQSRLSVLEAKLKMLKTYITLDNINVEDVTKTIAEIVNELNSIVSGMQTTLEKNKIKPEENEPKILTPL